MKNNIVFWKPMYHISLQDESCFNEMLDLWYESDYCEVKPLLEIKSTGKDSTLWPEARVWSGKGIYDILLYNNTLLDKYCENYRFALFANEVKYGKKESNWIFWPRWPRRYSEFLYENGKLSYSERNIESAYIGNKTAAVRTEEWSEYIELFCMGNLYNHFEKNMIFPYNQYLRKLSQARFGLCLRGVGPKSLREVELLGLGTVPIFTPGVSIDYYNKLEENVHFLYAEKPEDIPYVIENCSKEHWEWMSYKCVKWYYQNCSPGGSFLTTIEIFEKNNLI